MNVAEMKRNREKKVKIDEHGKWKWRKDIADLKPSEVDTVDHFVYTAWLPVSDNVEYVEAFLFQIYSVPLNFDELIK